MFLRKKTENSIKNSYSENGYLSSIQEGIRGVRRFHNGIVRETPDALKRLKEEIRQADAVIVGAGAGLSTSAGFTYSGERFLHYFADFHAKYGFNDMYSGGFYPYPSKEEYWAFWARNIYINRYMDPPLPVYEKLYELLKEKDYFVITTNVDHCFQKAGFEKERLFYTQGDYGLFQSTNPRNRKTYDNREWVIEALKAQGFEKREDGSYDLPQNGEISMTLPHALLPVCEDDGYPFTTNLRCDDSFVEDEGWKKASSRYAYYLKKHENDRVLYLELGVGANTPVIIKYPFWQRTFDNPNAIYACMNYNEAYCPKQIEAQSIVINDDILRVLEALQTES